MQKLSTRLRQIVELRRSKDGFSSTLLLKISGAGPGNRKKCHQGNPVGRTVRFFLNLLKFPMTQSLENSVTQTVNADIFWKLATAFLCSIKNRLTALSQNSQIKMWTSGVGWNGLLLQPKIIPISSNQIYFFRSLNYYPGFRVKNIPIRSISHPCVSSQIT